MGKLREEKRIKMFRVNTSIYVYMFEDKGKMICTNTNNIQERGKMSRASVYIYACGHAWVYVKTEFK